MKAIDRKFMDYLPRNANNGINTGERYELFYYDMEWKSAGTQTAKSNYLIYPSISANTLYWLRNLDHGTKEQAFIYTNGQQLFINHDAYRKLEFFSICYTFQYHAIVSMRLIRALLLILVHPIIC